MLVQFTTQPRNPGGQINIPADDRVIEAHSGADIAVSDLAIVQCYANLERCRGIFVSRSNRL